MWWSVDRIGRDEAHRVSHSVEAGCRKRDLLNTALVVGRACRGGGIPDEAGAVPPLDVTDPDANTGYCRTRNHRLRYRWHREVRR